MAVKVGKQESAQAARRAWRLLMRAAEGNMEATGEALRKMGLSPVMAHFLDELARMPPGPMSQLVARFEIDPGWVTDVVDKLEQRGEVVRQPSPQDRRVKIVQMTEKGRRTWRRIEELMETPPPELLDLPEEDLQALARVAERLSAAQARPAERGA